MKKLIALTLIFSLLLVGCTSVQAADGGDAALPDATVSDAAATVEPTVETTAATEEATEAVPVTEQSEPALTISPLPDNTMENLTDAILSVSLEEGGAYVDDTGKMQMDLKIYTYDKYDMVDISCLKVGDVIVRYSGEVTVTSIEQSDAGTILINGGLDNGGFNLVTEDDGIYYEMGYNDSKNWYEAGEATIRVSVDFGGIDSADPELGDVILYPGSFLVGEVTNYDFTPYNTTIRVENGQIIEINRYYIP